MLRKIIKWLLWISAAALGLAKFFSDWVGRSTVSEDFSMLLDRVRPMIEYLQSQPLIWLYIAVLLLALIGLSLHIPSQVFARFLPFERKILPRKNLPTLPGASVAMMVRLPAKNPERRSFLMFVGNDMQSPNIRVHISPDGRLVFTVTDRHGDEHTVDCSLGESLRYNEFIFIYAGFGVTSNDTSIVLWADGDLIKEARLNFRIDTNGLDVNKPMLGSDPNGSNSADVDLGSCLCISRTLTEDEIRNTEKYFSDQMREGGHYLEFRKGARIGHPGHPGTQA